MDYLEVDKEIPDQKYTCLSFLCPESMIKKRELYFMENFRSFYYEKCKENYDYLLNELKDNQILHDKLKEIFSVPFSELYELFLHEKKKELDAQFDKENNNQCSILGLKVRGSYPTLEQAQHEAQRKQKKDPNHNIYVCQTGYWVPFSPNVEEISNQEYANEKLNELMKEYNQHLQHKNDVWEQMTKLRIQKAIEEGQSNKENIEN